MRYGLLIFIGWIGCCSVSYGAFDSASTRGNCSPIVSGEVGGNVTIKCEGLSEGVIKTLNESLNKVGEVKDLLTLMSEKEKRLAEVQLSLSKEDDTILNNEKAELEDSLKHLKVSVETVKLKAAEEWAQRFRELQKQLAKLEEQSNAMDGEGNLEAKKELSQFAKQSQQQLEDGKLDEAGRLYDELIAKAKEQRIKLKDQLEKQLELVDDLEANTSHQRGQVYRLQYKPLQALPFLESAYRLRPENTKYAHAYALLLQNQNRHAQAISIYEQNLQRLRDKGDKANVANTLTSLGNLHQVMQRFKEGETSYQEALTIQRDLAKVNPQAYLSDVAMTLNNLGALYYKTQRLKEGEVSFQEALTIRRDLAKANPQAYLSDVVGTLNNLGVLYFNTQRFKMGEANLQEALTICRELAKTNPQAYLPEVAMMLNNLGVLYFNTHNTQRFEEAEANFQEALTIRRDLAKVNPEAYLPDVARTLNNLGALYQVMQRFKEGEASYQEALTIRRDLAEANPQAYRKDLADTFWNMALLHYEQGKTTEAHRYFDEAIPLYRKLWQAYPELYAKKFGENLLLNARTLPPKDTEMRCSLLGEAWQVAPSEYISVIGIYQSITLLLCQLR